MVRPSAQTFNRALTARAACDDLADPLANDPEAKRIKEWRHKLQRAFLSKTLPTAEVGLGAGPRVRMGARADAAAHARPQEMPTYDELFKTIESYDGMTIEYLQHSKIGKGVSARARER